MLLSLLLCFGLMIDKSLHLIHAINNLPNESMTSFRSGPNDSFFKSSVHFPITILIEHSKNLCTILDLLKIVSFHYL